ncbi:MAG: cytochrome c oxidase assembly factor 1 family protein [Chromatiales bacterium]|nr:cytochrome c oxidase assembly factor 1 family protein [Chromatiales bacterium]
MDKQPIKPSKSGWKILGYVFVYFFIIIVGLISYIALSVINMMKGEAYQLSLEAVISNPEVVLLVGEDPEPGFIVTGRHSYSLIDSAESVDLTYSITGSKSEAEVYVHATSMAEQLALQEITVVDNKTGEKIVIKTQTE